MKKALAFIRRDFLLATSYRMEFAAQIVVTLLFVPVFYYISTGINPDIENYFGFLLTGMGLMGFFSISMHTFSRSIREGQLMGTLEIVFLSPTSVTQLVLYSSLWIYLFLTVRFLAYLLLGIPFGLDLGNASPALALLVLMLAIPAFASLGIASAAIIVIFKRGEALTMPLVAMSFFFGNVVFKTENVLPPWLAIAAEVLPITHAARAIRLALFDGADLITLGPHLAKLSLFIVLLLPISLWLFRAAIRQNKVTGTLASY